MRIKLFSLLKYFLSLNLFILLIGCTSSIQSMKYIETHQTIQTNLSETKIPSGRIGLKLTPASLGESISLQQHLTVERLGHIDELDTVLEVDANHLNMVGLIFGRRIMAINYDGKTLQTWRDPRMPSQVTGENVLEDIELTLWPVNIIQQALPVGWRIEESNHRRVIYLDNVPMVMINYISKHGLNDKIILRNLRYHYQLTIQTVVN